MRIFILEDREERNRKFREILGVDNDLYIFDNVEKAKNFHDENLPFDLYLLDHDLDHEIFVNSNKPNTGYQFAKYLASCDIPKDTKIVIHSMNFRGAKNMYSVLRDFKFFPDKVPYRFGAGNKNIFEYLGNYINKGE